VAIPAEIDWLNPITGEIEIVNGVLCGCYECKGIADNFYFDIEQHGIPFTKSEYREHKRDRQKQYNEYIIRKAELQERAHTKETEALAGHGRPASVTTLFDLETGNMVPDPSIVGAVRWETLWRASIQED
jgi:hypothetical protein